MTRPGEGKPRASTTPAPGWVVALREERVRRDWTQQHLANLLGWSVTRLSTYEAGHRTVWPCLVEDWAAALGMRLAAVPVDAEAAR